MYKRQECSRCIPASFAAAKAASISVVARATWSIAPSFSVISILAANARWADEEAFDRLIDEFLLHVTDQKPITARQCIQALPEIAAGKPRLVPRIRQTLENADLTGYRDSMRPLILKDIIAALEQLG